MSAPSTFLLHAINPLHPPTQQHPYHKCIYSALLIAGHTEPWRQGGTVEQCVCGQRVAAHAGLGQVRDATCIIPLSETKLPSTIETPPTLHSPITLPRLSIGSTYTVVKPAWKTQVAQLLPNGAL